MRFYDTAVPLCVTWQDFSLALPTLPPSHHLTYPQQDDHAPEQHSAHTAPALPRESQELSYTQTLFFSPPFIHRGLLSEDCTPPLTAPGEECAQQQHSLCAMHWCPHLILTLNPQQWRCPRPWLGPGQLELVGDSQLTAGVCEGPSHPAVLGFCDFL